MGKFLGHFLTSRLHYAWQFWLTALRYFNQLNCVAFAGALAFTTLLTIVPIMVVSLYVLSMFPLFDTVGDKIQSFIFANFVPTSSQIISEYLKQFTEQAKQLPGFELTWLVMMVIFLIRTIERVFNHIWQLQIKKYQIWDWLRYWLVLTIIPIGLGASVVFSTFLHSQRFLHGAWQELESNLLWVDYLPTILSCIFFTLLYRMTPTTYIPWRYAFFSGLFAALLLKWSKILFTWSLLHFPTYQLIYGTLSTVPIFLLWIQISWMIILLGAVLCRTCCHRPPFV